MPNFYITLGQVHQHIVDGKKWDKDSVMEVVADNISVVEDYAFQEFGKSWCMVSNEAGHDQRFYPKGIIKTVTLK